MKRAHRQRALWAAIGVLVVIMLVVVGVRLIAGGGDATSAKRPDEAEKTTSATATVDETGFDVAIDGVRVVGPAGVAPVGTEVVVAIAAPDLGSFAGFASAATPGVEVTIGDGLQPAKPVALTFENAPDEDSAPEGTALAVAASTANGEGVEFADAIRTAAGVVVTTDHLSWFTPVWVGIDSFVDSVGEQVLIAMQVRTPEPDCFADTPEEDGGWKFASVRQQLVWPCVEVEDDGGVQVTLANNSPEAWLVTADQDATPHLPTTTGIVGAVLSAAALQFVDRESVVPMGPGTNAGFTVDAPSPPVEFAAELDAALTVVNAVATALATFVPAKKLETLAKAQCFIDLVGASVGSAEAPTGDLVGAVVRCFGDIVGGLTGAVVGLIASIPGALIALLDGAVRSIAGTDSFTVQLTRAGNVEGLTDFVGTWSGPIDQAGQQYTVVMTITEPDAQGRVGTVVYPELGNCSGYLDRAEVDGETLRVVETITENTDRCMPEVDLTLVLDGPDTLQYDANGGLATGVLTRGAPDSAGESSDAGVWPTDRDDGTPALYAFAGANMLGFPDWVACDTARAWCVLGGTDEHTVVEMDGLSVAGSVPATTADAAGALADLGVPPASIPEILTGD